MATVSFTLIYRENSITISPSMLPIVVSPGIGVVTAPLALFVSYVLSAATIARQTASVGPFIHP